MIVALSLIVVLLISVAVVGHQLEKAPEGFEDANGFHFLTREGSATLEVRGPAHHRLVGADKHPAII